jgi:putative addiction module CopG family antidote
MAQAVGSKVKSGGYNAASEVPRDGVQALPDHDAALERWLREDVVAGHEE